jgi:hypothetical protein
VPQIPLLLGREARPDQLDSGHSRIEFGTLLAAPDRFARQLSHPLDRIEAFSLVMTSSSTRR